MAGIMGWIWDKVGLGDPVEEEYEEVEEVQEEQEQPVVQAQPLPKGNVVPLPAKTASGGTAPSTVATRSVSGTIQGTSTDSTGITAATNNTEVVLFAPSKYEDMTEVVSYLRNGRPVIVSFDGLSESEMRHMLDFIFGAACALDGCAQKISNCIFIITPKNVDVTSNLKEALLARDHLVRSRDSRLSARIEQ